MKKHSHYLTHNQVQEGISHDDNHHNNIDDYHHYHLPHAHLDNRNKNSKILLFCLIATFSLSIIEATGGYFTHSITLQSDAIHMLTDAAGLLIAYLANNISKKPATINLTFGYGKAEAIGALVNCIFTLVLTCGLIIEVISRLIIMQTVSGISLLIIASFSLLINAVIAFALLHGNNSLNMKAAFIHALGDLFGSLIAVISGVLIHITQISFFDPLLALIIITLLLVSNYRIIKQSLIVLMAGVPIHLNYEQVGYDLANIANVASIHDLHIWYMSSNQTALSAHIVLKNPHLWQNTLLACQNVLQDKHKIEHITLQHEFDVLGRGFCENL